MKKTNKNDFIDVYVLETLNEIKNTVKQNIKLKSELEKQTDEKMKIILKDLVNVDFKNLQIDTQNNSIYTLLPIIDEREVEKIRSLLVLYYTALYYDNLDLLKQMVTANVNFRMDYDLRLQYLDKSISSKFEINDYIKKINSFGITFKNFSESIKNLSEEEREKYIEKFVKLFNIKYKDMFDAADKDRGYGRYGLENLFVKGNLDTFEYNTYEFANSEQLKLINFCNGKHYNEKTTIRLNNLIQSTNFSNRLDDFDLMMSIYSDEEIAKIGYNSSILLSYYSETPEMLQKAIELVALRPELPFYVVDCISKEKFMKISNCELIEIIDYIDEHHLLHSEQNVDMLSRTIVPKTKLKRIFKVYKK